MQTKINDNLINDVLERGVENIIPSKQKLEELLRSDKKINVYLGIDPTATKIHLGHAVPLRRLQAMAKLGHKVTFLIGDFTALIGDTSDKDGERPVLTYEQIEENFQTYKRQAEKILDFDMVEVRHNSEWLGKLNFAEVVNLTRHFSLNDFISRELIKKRLSSGGSVSLPEVLYPVMQGYDSYFLDADIQFGGTDQTFNMQAGRILNKDLRGKESFVVANGFLTGTDGRKMSKSWGNAIWLEDSAEEIFGKVMSIRDDLIVEYFKLATTVPLVEIGDIAKRIEVGENPMLLKRQLGRVLVEELCGKNMVSVAEEYFERTVVNKEAGEGVPIVKVNEAMVSHEMLKSLAIQYGYVDSNSAFRRLFEQGGIYLNNDRLVETDGVKLVKGENIFRFGKRSYLKVLFE